MPTDEEMRWILMAAQKFEPEMDVNPGDMREHAIKEELVRKLQRAIQNLPVDPKQRASLLKL